MEVCADRDCRRVELTLEGEGSATPTADLARGAHFWRVSAHDVTSAATWELWVSSRSAPTDTTRGLTLDMDADGYADVLAVAGYGGDAAAVFLGGAQGPHLAAQRPPLPPASAYGNVWIGRAAGDVNGDGYGDVILGGDGAFVYLGGAGGPSTTRVELAGPAGAAFGGGVAGLGDVDGDGYGDVAVLADHAHRLFLFRGGAQRIDLHGTDVEAPRGTGTGWVVPAGDVDGDGHTDVAVGGNGSPEVWIYRGSPNGLVTPALRVPISNLSLGGDLAGDVDGDGLSDLVFASGSGCAALVRGARAGTGTPTPLVEAGSPFAVNCTFGVSGGDVDGDGLDDVLIGGTHGWGVFVRAGGERTLAPLRGIPARLANLDAAFVPQAVGDVNGDGMDDVTIALINSRSPTREIYYGSAQG
ncbi:MAG: VCBS repeat-containing protein, partial [Deltaproteobacteria bacterium]